VRVLIAHVGYRQPGGEDAVVATESRILSEAGIAVAMCLLDSNSLDALPLGQRASVALGQADHAFGRATIRELIRKHSPDVVHFHNLYPLLGPGAMQEARSLGCAVVQTIHNFRMSCIAGTHVLHDEPCELCSPQRRLPGVARGCYRGSRLQSALIARGIDAQWKLATAGHGPDITVFLTDAMRQKYVGAGYPGDSSVVKPNSVDAGSPASAVREGVLFAGRLSAEKGIRQLVDAWPESAPVLTVAGAGPLAEEIACVAGANVHLVGLVPPIEVRALMRSARVVVMPSLCDEGQPLVMLESLSEGVPVMGFVGTAIADAMRGDFPDAVVARGDFEGLVAAIVRRHDGDFAGDEQRARALFDAHYTHSLNRQALLAIYERALATRA
jgi:glycosyltransferase involved in cell wall biosynthesis